MASEGKDCALLTRSFKSYYIRLFCTKLSITELFRISGVPCDLPKALQTNTEDFHITDVKRVHPRR